MNRGKSNLTLYEPHQAQETISYLIVGEKRDFLFDTGMGISDLKKVIAELTSLPIVVLKLAHSQRPCGRQLGILHSGMFQRFMLVALNRLLGPESKLQERDLRCPLGYLGDAFGIGVDAFFFRG